MVVLTGRPEAIREATIKELNDGQVWTNDTELIMRPVDSSRESTPEFKIDAIRTLSRDRDIVTLVGDRPEDIRAAMASSIPCALYASTMTKAEKEEMKAENEVGLTICDTWLEIGAAIDRFEAGTRQMAEFRSSFTDQYAKWLGDIDNKCRVIVTIAAALAALSGKLLLDVTEVVDDETSNWIDKIEVAPIGVALLCSVLAMIYAIRAFTSRRTSGPVSGEIITPHVKQWIATLLGRPKRWTFLPSDAIAEFRKAHAGSELEKARAHFKFFYSRYQTHDPNSLQNLRLLELRASNYSKLYAERMASTLLIASVALLVLWIIFKFVSGVWGL